MRLQEIDLASLAISIRAELSLPAIGYLYGKTELRDATVRLLGCSLLEAEQLVDTMVARGFVSYDAEGETAEDPGVWRFRLSLA